MVTALSNHARLQRCTDLFVSGPATRTQKSMCQCEQCGRNYADHRPKGLSCISGAARRGGCSGFCSEAGTFIRASPILDRSRNDLKKPRLINRAARRPGPARHPRAPPPRRAVFYFDGLRHIFSPRILDAGPDASPGRKPITCHKGNQSRIASESLRML